MKCRKNIGMAMLEVLIAMLVVAIGILPLVYLQIKADRGVISAYTKVEHNAAALSVMDLVAADANKDSWVFGLASGDCDTGCNGAGEWRRSMVDELLTRVLPNNGSGLVCITQEPVAAVPTTPPTATVDHSIIMTVTLWWFSAGRGQADFGGNNQAANSKEGAFTANDCNQLDTFADKLNIDTVSTARIF